MERVDAHRDEVAFLRLAGVVEDQLLLLAVDRLDARFPLAEPDDAEHGRRLAGEDLDDAGDVIGTAGLAGARRASTRSPTPGAGPRRSRADGKHDARRVAVLVRPLGGLAVNSPSRSRPVTSSTVTEGSSPGRVRRPCSRSTSPSSASSLISAFSAMRSAVPLTPKARAMSRWPVLPGCSAMKARISSRVGTCRSVFGFAMAGQVRSRPRFASLWPWAWPSAWPRPWPSASPWPSPVSPGPCRPWRRAARARSPGSRSPGPCPWAGWR